MYIISDSAFNELIGGEFYQVILAKKERPDMSVAELYNYQFDYFSYQGFRKFYRKHLEPIINSIKIVDDNSIIGRIIKKYIYGSK
jgi:hypothetical protein